MRVRQWAVVGAALVAAWAGGAGVAQATEDAAQGPGCTDLTALTASVDEGTLPDECGWPPVEPVDGCEILLLDTSSEGTGATEESTDPCSVTITVGVEGSCEDPESFVFTLNASGLAENQTYTIALGSDDFTDPTGTGLPEPLEYPFTTDATGAVEDKVFTAVEGTTFLAPDTGFTLGFLVYGDADEFFYVGGTEVEDCPPVVTEPVVTEPTTPAPTTPAPTTTPVAAPVVVTPVAAHPAVLANTGTPVTAAALLGGGLLVAGAGALVASRRRAS